MKDHYLDPLWWDLDADGNPVPLGGTGDIDALIAAGPTFFARRWRRCETVTVGTESVNVSTVFLALDHSLGLRSHGSAPRLPILFETMLFPAPPSTLNVDAIFGYPLCIRYTTKAEAIAGHQRIVRRTRAILRRRQQETTP